jgi:DNA modification methylase
MVSENLHYEGDLVLDNTMGSGTCGLASIKNNRKFIGIEKEKNYYDITIKRLQNYDANKTIHGQPIQSQMPNSCEPPSTVWG